MKKIILTILILLATANISYGAVSWSGNTCTITGDATVAQINDCLTGAVNGIVAQGKTGEITVVLPADTETWSGALTVNMGNAAYINVTKLTIQGAGTIPTGSTKGSAGSTVITLNGQYGIVYTGSAAKKFRLSNIDLRVSSATYDQNFYMITVSGTTLPSSGGGFRIDHNDFRTSYRGRKIYINSRAYGVIDHNYYRGTYNSGWYGMFVSVGEGSTGGNQSWYRGIGVNSWDQVFLEDNDVGGNGSSSEGAHTMFCDCENGGRVVARYNTILNMYFGGHGADSTKRACLSYVIHNNTTNITDLPVSGMSPWLGVRDGTHIVYDNTINETRSGVPVTNSMYAPPIYLRNYRSYSGWSTSNTSPYTNLCTGGTSKGCFGTTTYAQSCTSDTNCGGETGSCVTIDGGTGDYGYPCRDQLGISSSGGLGANQYVPYPSLFANNKRNGTEVTIYVPTDGYNENHIVEARDYCHHDTTLPATCTVLQRNMLKCPILTPL